MIKSISSKDQALVDKRIEEFCESSANLLKSIHARHGNKADVMTHRKRGAEKKKRPGRVALISDDDVDFHGNGHLDDSY